MGGVRVCVGIVLSALIPSHSPQRLTSMAFRGGSPLSAPGTPPVVVAEDKSSSGEPEQLAHMPDLPSFEQPLASEQPLATSVLFAGTSTFWSSSTDRLRLAALGSNDLKEQGDGVL